MNVGLRTNAVTRLTGPRLMPSRAFSLDAGRAGVRVVLPKDGLPGYAPITTGRLLEITTLTGLSDRELLGRGLMRFSSDHLLSRLGSAGGAQMPLNLRVGVNGALRVVGLGREDVVAEVDWLTRMTEGLAYFVAWNIDIPRVFQEINFDGLVDLPFFKSAVIISGILRLSYLAKERGMDRLSENLIHMFHIEKPVTLHDFHEVCKRDLKDLLILLKDIVGSHPHRLMRYFALKIARNLIMRVYPEPVPELLQAREIIVLGLQDPETYNVFQAMQYLNRINPRLLRDLSAEQVTSFAPPRVLSNPKLGIERYVSADSMDSHAVGGMIGYLIKGAEMRPDSFSLSDIIPIRSLGDFEPKSSLRFSEFGVAFARLGGMVEHRGARSKQEIVQEFLRIHLQSGSTVQVIETPQGKKYLICGLAKLAALKHAVDQGLIGRNWLDDIGPVTVMETNREISPHLIHRILTLGTDLTWENVIPASLDQVNSR